MDLHMVERNDTQPVMDIICKYFYSRYPAQFPEGHGDKLFFTRKDVFHAHFFFKFNGKSGPYSLKESGCSAVFSDLNVVNIFIFAPAVCPVNGFTARILGSRRMVKGGIKDQN